MRINNKITSMLRISRIVFIISLLLFVSFSIISAQKAKEDQFPYDQTTKNQSPPFKDRLFYGGNFGLQFGTITDIQVSPVIGYWVLPRVAVAVGPTYRYYKELHVATSLYGGK